jgi:hypothetical protein
MDLARIALQKVLEQHEASNLKHNMEVERLLEIQNKMKKIEQENENLQKENENFQKERNHSLEEAKRMHSNEEAKSIQLKLDIECLKQILEEKEGANKAAQKKIYNLEESLKTTQTHDQKPLFIPENSPIFAHEAVRMNQLVEQMLQVSLRIEKKWAVLTNNEKIVEHAQMKIGLLDNKFQGLHGQLTQILENDKEKDVELDAATEEIRLFKVSS